MIELIMFSPYTAIVYLVLCIGVAQHGRNREITPLGAFFISLFFTPLAGILFATASPKVAKQTGWTSPLQKQ